MISEPCSTHQYLYMYATCRKSTFSDRFHKVCFTTQSHDQNWSLSLIARHTAQLYSFYTCKLYMYMYTKHSLHCFLPGTCLLQGGMVERETTNTVADYIRQCKHVLVHAISLSLFWYLIPVICYSYLYLQCTSIIQCSNC